jgi:hypothetical protein
MKVDRLDIGTVDRVEDYEIEVGSRVQVEIEQRGYRS